MRIPNFAVKSDELQKRQYQCEPSKQYIIMLILQHKQKVHQCLSDELDPHYDVGQFSSAFSEIPSC